MAKINLLKDEVLKDEYGNGIFKMQMVKEKIIGKNITYNFSAYRNEEKKISGCILEKIMLDGEKKYIFDLRFDETKILWLNGQWIRKIFTEQGNETLFARTKDFWPEEAKNYPESYQKQVLGIIYDRLKTLSDLKTMTTYFFTDPNIDLSLILDNKFLKKSSEAELSDLLEKVLQKLEKISEDEWQADILQNALNELLEETTKKPAELFSLIRISLSYAPFSPALNLTMEVLGRNASLARLHQTKNAILN